MNVMQLRMDETQNIAHVCDQCLPRYEYLGYERVKAFKTDESTHPGCVDCCGH